MCRAETGSDFCPVHRDTRSKGSWKFEAVAPVIVAAVALGHTQAAAAGLAGVTPQTVSDWTHKGRTALAAGDTADKYAVWYTQLKQAKLKAAAMMEDALWAAGLGGNVTAMVKWLTVNMPDEWGDKATLKVEGGLDIQQSYAGVPTDELRAALRTVLAKADAIVGTGASGADSTGAGT